MSSRGFVCLVHVFSSVICMKMSITFLRKGQWECNQFFIVQVLFSRQLESLNARTSRRYRSNQTPQAATKTPTSKPSEMELPLQLRQDGPLHVREVVGTQRIARGNTVYQLSVASQPTDFMGMTFLNASGKIICCGFTMLGVLRHCLKLHKFRSA